MIDIAAITAKVRAANPLPAEVDDLDDGTRRVLEWRAAREGVPAQQLLDEEHVASAEAVASSARIDRALAAIRSGRFGDEQ